MAKLPDSFLQQMKRLLREEFPDFLDSYDRPRQQGIRANGLKISAERFRELSPFPLAPVPWAREGFYVPEAERPGKHPYYHAGLYYVQEPSAMAPVELLDVRPGDKVLDLCAAPGGKTTQIAAKLQGRGLLVANDNQPDRVKALVKNVELYGVTNAIVLNETPERLVPAMPHFFDKILIDAPCSGEGMFRKDEHMAKSWDEQAPLRYAAVQRDILAAAARLLKPGGRIVYSTCTFSPEENERTIAAFLREHPAFRVVPAPQLPGFSAGRPEWADCADARCASVAGTVRLWPHRLAGEGHYAAILEHEGGTDDRLSIQSESGDDRAQGRNKRSAGRGEAPKRGPTPPVGGEELFRAFAGEQLMAEWSGAVVQHRDFVYLAADDSPSLDGLKAARPGWFVGTVRSGRFEPSHALAMGLRQAADAVRSVSFEAGDTDAIRYLKGETLQLAPERLRRSGTHIAAKGYCLVCLEGYPLGWGKWLDGMLKNEYPPGWRWT